MMITDSQQQSRQQKEGAPDSVEQTTCQDTVQGTTRTTTTTQGEEKETSVIKTDAMGRETENTSKDRKGNILSSTETSYDSWEERYRRK